eukprot:12615289-Alexandrium_andersonii.AAC.1
MGRARGPRHRRWQLQRRASRDRPGRPVSTHGRATEALDGALLGRPPPAHKPSAEACPKGT